MNCQLVLCPGYNDGKELEKSLEDLMGLESVNSVALVPVGLTKYRENLTKLEPFDKVKAANVLDITEKYAVKYKEKYGVRKVYAADEFYLKAERQIPSAEFYGDFDQLDNGVGMWALFKEEAQEAIKNICEYDGIKRTVVTGEAAFPLINETVENIKSKISNIDCEVFKIRKDFFGEQITVAGLVTGAT